MLKYFFVFLTGGGSDAAEDGFFTDFITSTGEPVATTVIFLFLCSIIVLGGVNKGIERASRYIMPVLVVLVLIISVFSITISDDSSGKPLTGLDGLKVLLIPDFTGITVGKFFFVTLDAMGQLFYSLSIAMGIMIAYGSYVPDEANLGKSINQIEIFDTMIAVLAGVMIIPTVYVFMGREGLSASGPGLMFISLPKVFEKMGTIGRLVGTLFFAMVLFAALTSAVSVMEAVVSSFKDRFHMKRKRATLLETAIALVFGIIVCFGYNILYFELPLPNGTTGQVLDLMDYISNYLLMPIVAIATCILVGYVLTPGYVIEEVEKTGSRFGRKGMYIAMMKFIAPVFLIILFLESFNLIR